MARRTFVRGGRQVRETLWLELEPTRTTMAAASTAVVILSMTATELALRPFTVVRTIVHASLQSDQTGATENFDAAIGFAVVSDQASAIGVTAVPTPMTDLDSDLWFFHQILDGAFKFVSGVGVDPQGVVPSGGGNYESRAMRKVNGDQEVTVVTEASAISSGCQLYAAGRMLIKLH